MLRNALSRLLGRTASTVHKTDTPTTSLPALDFEITVARTKFESGKSVEALNHCRKLLQQVPDNADVLELVEDIAFATGNYSDAIVLLQAGLQVNPSEARIAYRLGCAYDAVGAHTEAIAAYERVLTHMPRHAKALCNLGSALQNTGRWSEALDCFERAAAIDPQLWQAQYNLGNFYKLQGQPAKAMPYFQQSVRLKRGPAAAAPPDTDCTTRSKLAHDIEQLNYLQQHGLLQQDYVPAIAALQLSLDKFDTDVPTKSVVDFSDHDAAQGVYNRLIRYEPAHAWVGPAINPALDGQAIEAAYAASSPGITHIDQFLVPEAVAALRRFCLESTFWFEFRYANGYVLATIEEGFICPLLVQIAEELPKLLPNVIGDHKLTHLWAFKYDSRMSGIAIHADFAAINVNFWITPDDANLKPGSGGLVVWDKEAPLEWDFDEYNRNTAKIQKFLDETEARPVVVPYRQNRAVIFNSDLIHKTDEFEFAPGYENRRINITMLFGYRKPQEGASS